jgi:hypothetical protein
MAFNYNPGVQDVSGQIMAGGLEKALSSVSRGIAEHRKKLQEKEAGEAAIEWGVKKGYFADAAEGKAAVKALGGGTQALAVAMQVQEREAQARARTQQMQMVEMQMAEHRDRSGQRTADAGALRVAMGERPSTTQLGEMLLRGGDFQSTMPGPAGAPLDQRLERFVGAGGRADPFEALQAIEAIKASRRGPPSLQFQEDPATGARFAVGDKGNFASSGVNPAKQTSKSTGAAPIVSPDGKFFKSHEADDWRPLAAGRPPSPPDIMLQKADPELYEAQRREYLRHVNGGGGDGSSPASGGGAPVEVRTKAEFDRLPKGARFIYNGREGTKS